MHLFNYECQNHAYKIRKRAEILFLWRSYKILLHLREITCFVLENNEAFASDDNKGSESKHSPRKKFMSDRINEKSSECHEF